MPSGALPDLFFFPISMIKADAASTEAGTAVPMTVSESLPPDDLSGSTSGAGSAGGFI